MAPETAAQAMALCNSRCDVLSCQAISGHANPFSSRMCIEMEYFSLIDDGPIEESPNYHRGKLSGSWHYEHSPVPIVFYKDLDGKYRINSVGENGEPDQHMMAADLPANGGLGIVSQSGGLGVDVSVFNVQCTK